MTNNDDILIASENIENYKNSDSCQNCAEVVGKFLISLILILILIYFSDKMFDIQGYIEDHGLEYQNIESLMILFLLIVFYFISKLVLNFLIYIYNLISKKNKCDNNGVLELIVSFLCSIVYIYIASNYFTSVLSPSGIVQKEMLWETIFWWLTYLLFLNIVLSSSIIEERIIDPISNMICRRIIYPIWNSVKGIFRGIASSVRGKNDQ